MKKLFIANWKMQLDYKGSLALAKSYNKQFRKVGNEIVVVPDFITLAPVKDLLKLKLGAQDVSPFVKGAYTGEVSAKSLKQLGVKYVLIGHSERRGFFKEDSAILKLKLMAALDADLIPVLCIGENITAYKAKKNACCFTQTVGRSFIWCHNQP